MSRLLVDTWAWLALHNPRDNFHKVAITAYNEFLDQEYLFVTTNFILAESYTNLRRWGSPKLSIRFGRLLQQAASTDALEIVRVTAEDEVAAWSMFEKYDELTDLSFIDCTTFAVMRRLGLSEAFTGDKHFSLMGLTIRP